MKTLDLTKKEGGVLLSSIITVNLETVQTDNFKDAEFLYELIEKVNTNSKISVSEEEFEIIFGILQRCSIKEKIFFKKMVETENEEFDLIEYENRNTVEPEINPDIPVTIEE